jgi:predicted HicB family RNase H-like nuclease
MDKNGKYTTQKKYLSTQKQLRVWIDPKKYEMLKAKAAQNGTSVYALVNQWVDRYLQEVPEG